MSSTLRDRSRFSGAAFHAGFGRIAIDRVAGTVDLDEVAQDLLGFDASNMPLEKACFLGLVQEPDRVVLWRAIMGAGRTPGSLRKDMKIVADDGTTLMVELIGAEDEDGHVLGVLRESKPSDGRHAAAEVIARELVHRMQNLLTIVTSLYRQSARGAPDVRTVTDAFLPRLQALAALNDRLRGDAAHTVDMPEMVSAILRSVSGSRVSMQIAEFSLNPAAAQTVALVLGELMTNALKHGGLSTDVGRVDLSILLVNDEETFRLDWRETTSFPVVAPKTRTGFGMNVLKTMTSATFDGDPQFDWQPGGLRFSCEWDAYEMSSDNTAAVG